MNDTNGHKQQYIISCWYQAFHSQCYHLWVRLKQKEHNGVCCSEFYKNKLTTQQEWWKTFLCSTNFKLCSSSSFRHCRNTKLNQSSVQMVPCTHNWDKKLLFSEPGSTLVETTSNGSCISNWSQTCSQGNEKTWLQWRSLLL